MPVVYAAGMEMITVAPEAFAGRVVELIRAAAAAPLTLGLSTGRTPVPVYAALAAAGVVFAPGSFLFAPDEYVAPDPSHPGTNASFFARHWPAPPLPPVAVPRCDTADADAEMQRFCAEIDRRGGIDLLLLGIGENGHICFNEPGTPPDAPCRAALLTEQTRAQARSLWQEPPAHGMTLGIPQIMAARHAVLLATGEAKRAVLTAALRGPVGAEVPASYLQRHPRLTVITDLTV